MKTIISPDRVARSMYVWRHKKFENGTEKHWIYINKDISIEITNEVSKDEFIAYEYSSDREEPKVIKKNHCCLELKAFMEEKYSDVLTNYIKTEFIF